MRWWSASCRCCTGSCRCGSPPRWPLGCSPAAERADHRRARPLHRHAGRAAQGEGSGPHEREVAQHRAGDPRSPPGSPPTGSDRLRAAARPQGVLVPDLPEVLFVCVRGAGRSQMAAALLDHHAAGRVRVRSAGSAPADTTNPAVISVMGALGIDLTKEFPKPLTTEAVQAADVVITMGCGDACPVFPGKRYLDWQLEDPAGKPAEQVRPIRDEIDRRVRELLAELVPAR